MGRQRSRKKKQELSLAAHSEQLKTEHADRKTRKRGRGKAGLLQVGKGAGRTRGGKRREQGRGGESRGGGGGAHKGPKKQQKGRGWKRTQTGVPNVWTARQEVRWRVLEVTPKTPGPVASADKS